MGRVSGIDFRENRTATAVPQCPGRINEIDIDLTRWRLELYVVVPHHGAVPASPGREYHHNLDGVQREAQVIKIEGVVLPRTHGRLYAFDTVGQRDLESRHCAGTFQFQQPRTGIRRASIGRVREIHIELQCTAGKTGQVFACGSD